MISRLYLWIVPIVEDLAPLFIYCNQLALSAKKKGKGEDEDEQTFVFVTNI